MTAKETVGTAKPKAAKKKASPASTKAGKAAKAAGDKAIMEMASNMPHGEAKRFVVLTKELDEIEGNIDLQNKRKRGVRASLKEMKVNLRPYDFVRKLRKMESVDVKGFEADVAMYKEQLGMDLSVHQQVIKKELEGRREASRDAMIDAGGGDSGKEVGTTSQPAGNGNGAASASAEPPVPEKNEKFSIVSPGAPVSAAAH